MLSHFLKLLIWFEHFYSTQLIKNHSLSVQMVACIFVFACWTVRNTRICVFCITKASVDIGHSLVHGHVYETSAQAIMGEDEQHGL